MFSVWPITSSFRHWFAKRVVVFVYSLSTAASVRRHGFWSAAFLRLRPSVCPALCPCVRVSVCVRRPFCSSVPRITAWRKQRSVFLCLFSDQRGIRQSHVWAGREVAFTSWKLMLKVLQMTFLIYRKDKWRLRYTFILCIWSVSITRWRIHVFFIAQCGWADCAGVKVWVSVQLALFISYGDYLMLVQIITFSRDWEVDSEFLKLTVG